MLYNTKYMHSNTLYMHFEVLLVYQTECRVRLDYPGLQARLSSLLDDIRDSYLLCKHLLRSLKARVGLFHTSIQQHTSTSSADGEWTLGGTNIKACMDRGEGGAGNGLSFPEGPPDEPSYDLKVIINDKQNKNDCWRTWLQYRWRWVYWSLQ